MTDQPISHEQIMQRLANGERRFARIEASLDKIAAAVEPLPAMKESVDSTKELMEAWSAVKTGGRFVKWTSGILAAVGVIYAVLKGVVVQALASGLR